MAGDARAEPGQNTFYSHADHAGAEGIAGAFADTRGRQGAEGFVGRSAAGHQYSGIYGGRGAAVEWRNADERTAEEFFVHDPAAVGSGGSDHSVEFSSGDSGVENRAGAGVREYGGVQAGDFDAVDGDEDRGDFRAGWIAGGRAESGDGVGTRDGRRAGAESARARVVVYRVERGGLRAVCIRSEQAGLPAGVLNLVMGSGRETGDELVQNPHVHGLSFTGSNEVGCALYASDRSRLDCRRAC